MNEPGRTAASSDFAERRADLRLVIPCYNEEDALPPTVQKRMRAFENQDIRLELVCVDNGIPADRQVGAEDWVRRYEAVIEVGGPVVGKVRRRFRMDSLLRKCVSVAHNLFVRACFVDLIQFRVSGTLRRWRQGHSLGAVQRPYGARP